MVALFANSGGPDQRPCSAVSDLGLHCLPNTLLGVSILQWVKHQWLIFSGILIFESRGNSDSSRKQVFRDLFGKVYFIKKMYVVCTTVLLTSLGKMFFTWRFILNENLLFWLTISYQKPFVFSISVFCCQIFTLKLNLRLKVVLTYAISIVKWLFGNFV